MLAEHSIRISVKINWFDLTLTIVVINGPKRLELSFRNVPGKYQPATKNNVRTGVPWFSSSKTRSKAGSR